MRPWRRVATHSSKETAIQVPIYNLISSLALAMDLVSPAVVGHHRRVGFIAGRMGQALGLGPGDLADLLFAGMLHDAGAFSLKSRLDALAFDTQDAGHADVGARLLARCPSLAPLAVLVQHHHSPWKDRCQWGCSGREVLLGNVIHCADRVDAASRTGDAASAKQRIEALSGSQFAPEVVQAFREAASEPAFWEKLATVAQDPAVLEEIPFRNEMLDLERISEFSEAISHIIDFRSRFTATHSKGVSAASRALAGWAGMAEEDVDMLAVAGDLHDLGKLGVPTEILDKPGKLDASERESILRHPLDTQRALAGAPELAKIAAWAGDHHERIDGGGYPRGVDGRGLDLGSRIMAVADVFTAVTEDRPYRAGMDRKSALQVLQSMAGQGVLDAEVA
ncbi:MAG: HD-GYP domain-containing protein, partial [Desulfovibrionaceae bacterium]